MVVDLGSRSIERDHLGSPALEQPGALRGDQSAVGVETVACRFAGEVVEDVRKIMPQHRLTPGDGPFASAQQSGLVGDVPYLLEGKFLAALGRRGRNTDPAVAAVVVTTVG